MRRLNYRIYGQDPKEMCKVMFINIAVTYRFLSMAVF